MEKTVYLTGDIFRRRLISAEINFGGDNFRHHLTPISAFISAEFFSDFKIRITNKSNRKGLLLKFRKLQKHCTYLLQPQLSAKRHLEFIYTATIRSFHHQYCSTNNRSYFLKFYSIYNLSVVMKSFKFTAFFFKNNINLEKNLVEINIRRR